MKKWVTLGEYLDKERLMETEAILNANKVFFRAKSPETHLHAALGQGTSIPIVIQVLEDQYEQAKQCLDEHDASVSIVEVPIEQYEEEELREIALHPEEWHEAFVSKAKMELDRRGVIIEEGDTEEALEKKLDLLKTGSEPKRIIFYFMWFFAIMGGYIGIIAGYFYWQGTTKGPDDRRYALYAPKYRDAGFYMFVIGILSAIVQTYLYLQFY